MHVGGISNQAIANGWSRNVLALQIDSNLYQRQGNAITNFERTLPPDQSDLHRSLLKDPYCFSFLTIENDAKEAELERGLVTHIRDFLIELGVGFAFLGSQYPIEVSGKEYRLDLLFYHVQLRCYVVLDLKMGEFEPEYSGKMNFYIEFAIGSLQNPIGVATYKLRDELPNALQQNFPTAEQLQLEMELALSEMDVDQEAGNI